MGGIQGTKGLLAEMSENLANRVKIYIDEIDFTGAFMNTAKISVKEAQSMFSDVIDRAALRKERTVMTRRGKTVAVVVPVEDYRILQRIEKEDREDVEDARRELQAYRRDGKSIPWERIKK
jgi:prevent-host-death family protein